MKVLVFVFLCICATVLAEDFLDTVVHHYHYHALGPDVTNAHMACYLDEGPCDEVAASFKSIIPEALTTQCARCSDGQKSTGWSFLTSINDYSLADLERFKQKYDPENKYFDAAVEAIRPKD